MADIPIPSDPSTNDVDISEVTVSSVPVRSASALQIDDSTPLTVSQDGTVTITDQGDLVISALPEPLDVSGATLDVSAAEVDVDLASQSLSPLTITDDGNLAVAAWNAGTLPTEQQTPVGVEDGAGAQVNPAESEPQGNWSNGYDNTITTADTTVGTLTAGAVPDGVEVLVQADPGNTDPVKVGLTATPAVEVAAGTAFTANVTDRSQIRYQANTAGDTIHVSHEVQ